MIKATDVQDCSARIDASVPRPQVPGVSSVRYLLSKLRDRDKLRKLVAERLTEPLHLNIASLFAACGPFRVKVAFDLVLRPQYAYGVLRAAELAALHGIRKIYCIEFGVAAGSGLMNMAYMAAKTSKITGVTIEVHGFDTGAGMPPPVDYRDHPELYATGDFPMDFPRLQQQLPENANLHIGQLSETVPRFLSNLDGAIGLVALDVDYYSSSKIALQVFDAQATDYLPACLLYVDDMHHVTHNPWSGEILAINEFNASHNNRKIAPYAFLRSERLFKNAAWIDHFFVMHTLDHPVRVHGIGQSQRRLDNPYLN
jgi:hypothetical protein